MRIATASLLVPLLVLLAACGQRPGNEGVAPAKAKATSPPIAPAIIPPAETMSPAEPPSYEVAIASAAADRHEALERCAKQPEAVRTRCEQEANAAFADAEQGLQDLRGNQQ